MKIDVIKEKLTNIIEGTELEIFSIQPKKRVWGTHFRNLIGWKKYDNPSIRSDSSKTL